MSLTRRDLARALKEELGGTITANDEWIQSLLNIMVKQVAAGERVELRGFGTFESREIKAHKTVVPATGKAMKNPKSYTVDFRPAKDFKEKLKASGKKNKRGKK